MSGGPAGAAAGTLSIMAGCKKTDPAFLAALPLLLCYSNGPDAVSCFGGPGMGMAAKLVNQALVGMHVQATCEALTLAERLGLTDIALLSTMLATSWGQSRLQGIMMLDYIRAKDERWRPLDEPCPAPLRNLDKVTLNLTLTLTLILTLTCATSTRSVICT